MLPPTMAIGNLATLEAVGHFSIAAGHLDYLRNMLTQGTIEDRAPVHSDAHYRLGYYQNDTLSRGRSIVEYSSYINEL